MLSNSFCDLHSIFVSDKNKFKINLTDPEDSSTPSSNVIDALAVALYFFYVLNKISCSLFSISFKATYRGVTMSDTNIHAEYMDEQSTLTRSQAEEIFRELEEQRAQERKLQANGTDLPLEIREALDSASSAQLRTTPSNTRKPYNNIAMIRGQKQRKLINNSSMTH